MDPNTLISGMHASREKLRAVLLAGQPGYEDADVFPRSATMRMLLDPRRRGIATSAVGALASLFIGRRLRKTPKRAGIGRALLGMFHSRR